MGASIGALTAGRIAAYGRWKGIMISNAILLVGVGINCIPSFYALVIGRIIYGYSAGLFSFLTPKYISEVSPVEVSGIFGGVSQLAVTVGILLPSLLNPFENDMDAVLYVYILFLAPIMLSVIQILLMITQFNFDTPPVMKSNGELVKLRGLFAKIYTPYVVQQKIEEVQPLDLGSDEISYTDILTNP